MSAMNKSAKFICALLFVGALQIAANSQTKRSDAENRIASCYATDRKGCTPQTLQSDGAFLIRSYRAGDKSVLPSLMRVNAMSVGLRSLDSRFFAKAMLDDVGGFLSALSSTQDSKDAWRNSEAIGSACDCPGVDIRDFEAARRKLSSVKHETALFPLAQRCRKDLEDANATLILTYFPPNTFGSRFGPRAGDFTVKWYSSVLYGLEDKPLWPPDAKHVTYRFIWMRSFHDQVSITMTVQPEGDAQLGFKVYRRIPGQLESRTQLLNKEQVQKVLALIEQANFWNLTTEGDGPQGNDGAEWVLEGVRNGQYHIVTRWDAKDTPFGRALLELLRLSNYNPPTNQIY